MSPSIQMQRAIAAVKAMKLLGFSQGVAKSVLKELLKVYANNWEYIEAENYRLLADAILDSQDSKNFESNKKEAAVTDELIRPLKRLRRIEDPGPSQSTTEPEVYGETLPKKKILMASSDGTVINLRDRINKPEEAQCSSVRRGASLLPDALLKNGTTKIGEVASQHAINFEDPSTSLGHTSQKLTRHTMCSDYQREEQYLSDRAGNAECYREPKMEPDSEVLRITAAVSTSTIPDKSMDVIINDISTNYNVPIGVVALNGIPSGITTNKDEPGKVSFYGENALHGLTVDSGIQLAPNKANDIEYFQVSAQNEHANIQEKFSTNVNIASSNTGKVKLSLTCSFDCQNFKKPSIESVFKIVEDRCLKSYKILHPDFSLMNLMKEICQSAADLAVESGVPQENVLKVSTQEEYLKSSQSPIIHRRLTRRSLNGSPNLVSLETLRTSMNGLLQSSVHIDGESDGKLENCAPDSTGHDVSQCLATLPLHEDAIIASSPRHDQYDIAKGEERRTISLINEFNSENTPPYFRYISWNAVYQSAHVNFSLAQIGEDECCVNCFGNCLSVIIPCACARETSGEFVYTQDGLLKKKFLDECISMSSMDKHYVCCKNCPIGMFNGEDKSDACKGHPVRKFIKECWSKCGCNKQCGNRVVQRGITRNLQVFYTVDGKGWGLRTLEELPRGAFVCEYVGEILTCRELNDRTVQRCGSANHSYALVLDADWGSEKGLRDEALCLDATFYGNVGRFVNHRCFDANLVDVPVEWETHDHHYYHLAYFTTRKVEALEELTWDYGVDFKCRAHPIKAFKCLCGSRYCRDSCRSKARMRESSSK